MEECRPCTYYIHDLKNIILIILFFKINEIIVLYFADPLHLELAQRRRELNIHCPNCMEGFNSRQGLTEHMIKKCAIYQEKPFACPYCPSRFMRPPHLKRHILNIHMFTNTKRQFFCCPKCNKNYKYKNHLNRHIRDECGVEPKFHCTLCPYRCKQKSSLKGHIQRRHCL